MFKITIPVPCHQDWNAMASADNGRHCNACAKTVMDFTSMNDNELRNFFTLKKEENICGRFHRAQLHQPRIDLPENIFQLRMPRWKRFLAACLLAFGTTLFSCDTGIKGEAKIEIEKTISAKALNVAGKMDEVPAPVVLPGNIIVGALMIPVIPEEITTGKISIQAHDPIACTTVGEVILVIPDSTIKISEDTLEINKLSQDLMKADLPHVITGDSMFIPSTAKPDTLQKKKPPKADSVRCDGISKIYS